MTAMIRHYTDVEPITAESMARDYALMAARFDPVRDKSAMDVIRRVATKHGVTVPDLRGPCKVRKLVRARWEAMAIINEDLGLSLTQTATFFHRDHTTVLSGVRNHNKLKGKSMAKRKTMVKSPGPGPAYRNTVSRPRPVTAARSKRLPMRRATAAYPARRL